MQQGLTRSSQTVRCVPLTVCPLSYLNGFALSSPSIEDVVQNMGSVKRSLASTVRMDNPLACPIQHRRLVCSSKELYNWHHKHLV